MMNNNSITKRNIESMTTKATGKGNDDLDITTLRVAIHSCKLVGQSITAAKLEKLLERRFPNGS